MPFCRNHASPSHPHFDQLVSQTSQLNDEEQGENDNKSSGCIFRLTCPQNAAGLHVVKPAASVQKTRRQTPMKKSERDAAGQEEEEEERKLLNVTCGHGRHVSRKHWL